MGEQEHQPMVKGETHRVGGAIKTHCLEMRPATETGDSIPGLLVAVRGPFLHDS